jgi:hypothetical protein
VGPVPTLGGDHTPQYTGWGVCPRVHESIESEGSPCSAERLDTKRGQWLVATAPVS